MITKLFRKWRVIILILFLIFAYIAINPQFSVTGVAIKSIDINGTAYKVGMQNPTSAMPTQQEIILSINNKPIEKLSDYSKILSEISDNSTLRILTDKNEYVMLKTENLGITVANPASSNIKKGLDLQGGTRVVLQPESKITDQERDDIIAVMSNRLNVYGLSDIKIKPADDLLGNKYIVIELAGATKEEVKELIGKQGSFEARIGNETVFVGGKKDIVFVCRNDGTCSGIRSCEQSGSENFCKFEFAITLSQAAADMHAKITKDIEINTTQSGQQILAKPIDFYLDGKLVDSLQIAADLKGKSTTQIAISGPGGGKTKEEAINEALKNMNKLQTILITGSLPTKLNIVKLDNVSPFLGEAFIKNAFLVGLLAVISVVLVVFIRYRQVKISIAMIITLLSELFLLLGFAAFFKYNLDLAAIAGLVVAIGTGVDDQIVIADETVKGKGYYNWKDRLKKAFFIIFSSYATTVVAMIPLFKAGAGLLTGFALVTIVGVSIGVFITRPAYATILEVLSEE
ncbi:MAG: hypothetical protein AB1571_00745 [Nanoarchaeota archaeon]